MERGIGGSEAGLRRQPQTQGLGLGGGLGCGPSGLGCGLTKIFPGSQRSEMKSTEFSTRRGKGKVRGAPGVGGRGLNSRNWVEVGFAGLRTEGSGPGSGCKR